MCRTVDFSLGRYATDSGPQCSTKCCAEGETLWVYIVQWPYDHVVGQCASCHDVANFALRSDRGTVPEAEVTIGMIKAAHEHHLDLVTKAERAAA
jgi:hypothetical protein